MLILGKITASNFSVGDAVADDGNIIFKKINYHTIKVPK